MSPEESPDTSFPLGWQEQVPLISSIFMIGHLGLLKFSPFVWSTCDQAFCLHASCPQQLLGLSDLELQVLAAKGVLGVEPESFGRGTSAPNH